jgi:Protein of unknown function (DUF3341)
VTHALIVAFADAHRLTAAARSAKRQNYRLLDAFTPFPLEGLSELLDMRPSRIRLAMFCGGLAMAALAYGLEYFSAAVNYPYNAGGRPLNAWPAFMLVPFATGILLASICGFVAFLFETGLPRLHDPLFDLDGFDRASQDAFMLAIVRPETAAGQEAAMAWLRLHDAQIVDEVEL